MVDEETKFEGIITIEDIRAAQSKKNVTKVADLQIRPIPTIRINAQAREAFDLLIQEKLPFLIAVDSKQRVRGVVTKTSLVKALAEVVWRDEDEDEDE